jgi:hypothetical protein
MAAAKAMTEKEHATLCVTFGVTWGKQGYASASLSKDLETERSHLGSRPNLGGAARSKAGLRGNLVETTSSGLRREAPKSLKKMVGTTGIEPVTPTMSR